MRKFTLLKTRKAETLLHDIEQIQKRITERAYDVFRNRGAALGAALNDWLAAERQTIWKPQVEVCQKDNRFVIEAALAGVEPRQLDLQVTHDTLLIKADTPHTHPETKGIVHVCEFQPGPLFRRRKPNRTKQWAGLKLAHVHRALRLGMRVRRVRLDE